MASTIKSIRPVYVPYDSDISAESIEDYKPGGFHPTHLGDLLGREGRYRVVHKLGHGGFGTVWLCRDLEQKRWRAVKILAASHSNVNSADLRICELLEDLSARDKDVRVSHVVVPEDHFWHEGPNGKHLCVVMPVLGPNLEDAAEAHQYQEEPLKRICYQLVLAMKFLHDKGICHGDFRPNNICYVLKGIDELEEDDLVRVLGRPTLLCYVDDEEYDWRSDYAGDDEEGDDPEDMENGPDSDDVETSPDSTEDDEQANVDLHEPRYIVIPSNLAKSSEYVSNDIAVIDFGESFLASKAPASTGIPEPYCAPEAFFENCSTFGFGSDIWALGCCIFEVRRSGEPFLYNGGLLSLLRYWEDLNGPLPEPYRSSLATQGTMHVPEDASQWVSLDAEQRRKREAENMGRTGVHGSLHMFLLLEQRFIVPLAEGEVQPPPPPRGRGFRASPLAEPNEKVVAYEMSEREALELMDLFKKIFAWKPEDRITAAEILKHPWFDSCREGRRENSISSAPESMGLGEHIPEHAEVPDCGILMYLPSALRQLIWLYGLGGSS